MRSIRTSKSSSATSRRGDTWLPRLGLGKRRFGASLACGSAQPAHLRPRWFGPLGVGFVVERAAGSQHVDCGAGGRKRKTVLADCVSPLCLGDPPGGLRQVNVDTVAQAIATAVAVDNVRAEGRAQSAD